MYIKQVIIQGFKSYREQTVLEPFDKRHNVVVGRNGSGKSNFFHAIQFVLSDEFSHLRPEQRLALLHEGAGPRVISAFVEIIFDNSDNRIPIEREEIFLRRVIGSKKDQFFLNKKLVPRSEVVNLLETAGLSSSNPYYIVKQGKINQMATAPDSHRLKLLREVAGTRVYDERREESISILNQAVGKVEKINEFLQTIEERLQTLEEETKELKEYQKWDKARRLLEFIIHDTEHKENTKRLEELEQQRSSGSKERQQLVNQVKEAQDNVREANKLVKAARAEVAATREERDVLLTEQHQLQQERSRLELGIRDLERDVRADDAAKDKAENELDRVRKQISEVKRELEELKPKYEEMKTREEEISRELSLDQQKRRELIARQGRGTQFTSKHDRDAWIERELVSLNKQIKDKREHERKLREELDRDEKKITELEKKMEETGVEIERQRVTINKLQEQHYECKKKKDLEQSTRNELWRKETSLTHKLSSLREDLSKAERALCATAGKAILNGCASVRTVVQTFREKGGEWADVAARYHGLVVENFTCDRAMYTAVEMTAGNRLFHHIVESDSVGTAILREMNRQGLPGEVAFMPLNRLRVRDYVYPRDENAIAMISKLQYGAQHASCMKYIFGKSLVCRSLRAAADLSRQFNLDCVTLEGDQVSSKGSLTGGYFNQSRSRLEMQKTRSSLLEQISSLEEELAILKLQLHSTESSINNIVSDMQRAETKQGKARDIFDKVQAALRLMREELASLTGLRGPRERALERTCSSLEQMLATRDGLQAERRQDLMSQLSSAEQQELEELTAAIRRLTRENEDAFSTRLQLEAHKNKRESLLTNNLIRRESELLQALAEISSSDHERGLSVLKSELRSAETRASQLAAAAELAGKRLGAARASETHAGLQLERWTNKEKEAQEKLEEDTKDLEKMAAKEVLLQEKVQESLDKMAALGSVPGAPELRATYNNMSVSQLFKELEKVNHHLKEYSHVNLKALDQLNRFSDQKERLYRRKEELDVGGEKIRSLIEILESRKLEAIEFTFKQVSKYFTDVLQRLAPRASGQLVMRLATDGDRSQRFVGVGARVSFCGGDMRDLNQLSGGQKTLVALALIFAIQKADPAPFYLFDEIDQALDSSHRAAIADMIQELSSSAQFITTTFRPELLEHAHKFYGVKFRNKVSHVECVTREEAMNFVEDGAAVMPV